MERTACRTHARRGQGVVQAAFGGLHPDGRRIPGAGLQGDGIRRDRRTDQTRRANVRIIAASNRPLEPLVADGSFRRDLYYRLRGFELGIPPLRERPEDIQVLSDYLMKKYAAGMIGRRVPGIAAEAMQKLRAYAFPGNVRELENEIRRMVAVVEDGEFITLKHLSPEIAKSRPRPGRLLGADNRTTGRRSRTRWSIWRHSWSISRCCGTIGTIPAHRANWAFRASGLPTRSSATGSTATALRGTRMADENRESGAPLQ